MLSSPSITYLSPLNFFDAPYLLSPKDSFLREQVRAPKIEPSSIDRVFKMHDMNFPLIILTMMLTTTVGSCEQPLISSNMHRFHFCLNHPSLDTQHSESGDNDATWL